MFYSPYKLDSPFPAPPLSTVGKLPLLLLNSSTYLLTEELEYIIRPLSSLELIIDT